VEHLVAAEVVARATETNRLNHLFYFQLGAAYERNKQFDEATQSFRKCLELAPDFSEALNYLGYMWAERGENLAEAREMIEKAVKQEPRTRRFSTVSDGCCTGSTCQGRPCLPAEGHRVFRGSGRDVVRSSGRRVPGAGESENARAAWQKALTLEPNDDKPPSGRSSTACRRLPVRGTRAKISGWATSFANTTRARSPGLAPGDPQWLERLAHSRERLTKLDQRLSQRFAQGCDVGGDTPTTGCASSAR